MDEDGNTLVGSGSDEQPSSKRVVRTTLAASFDGRRNSLNFLRLVLALTVVCSHALTLGGTGRHASITAEDVLNTTPGTVAVYGFFGISGFLIARSATRNHLGRFLWQRFLRIFPGYWVCLIVTAFVIGVIAWYHPGQAYRPRCGLSCYLDSSTGPFQYLYHNALLRVNQASIAHTPRKVALVHNWNVSLWTLEYEFACYLIVGIFAVVGLLRRRALLLVLTGALWLCAAYVTFTKYDVTSLDATKLLGLLPLFLTGSLVYLYWDKIPDSGYIAAISAAVFVGSLWLPFGGPLAFDFYPRLNAPTLFSFALVYPLLWLGIHLPFHRIGAHNDYSYGVYVYASPVQQLLAIWGVQHWGMPAYTVLGIVGTVPLAVASWWLVEKRALRLKKARFGQDDATALPAP
jgi:peptidoglycan/LPS O-acetylase OafA/YrhL